MVTLHTSSSKQAKSGIDLSEVGIIMQSTSVDGAQSVSPALLRSKSGNLGAQGAPQGAFSSLSSVRPLHNMNLLGNAPNVSSAITQSLGSGFSNSRLSHSGSFQHGGVDNGPEFDLVSAAANELGFTLPHSSFALLRTANPSSSSQDQNQQILNSSGNQILPDQGQSQDQQVKRLKFQHGQHSLNQLHSQKQQYHAPRGVLGDVVVKLRQRTPKQQVQSPQQSQFCRGISPVRTEPNLEQQILLQPQQHQPLFELSRQTSQAAAAAPELNLLNHQHILQQQQQSLKALPQQQPQLQPQFQQQKLQVKPAAKLVYKPGMCARRLTDYMCLQQQRPNDNNIEFWKTFITDFFAPNAKKKWCISLYGNNRETNSGFPQDVWHCEICNHKPGRGYETTFEVLPRLCKTKYDSGTLEELLFVDMPHEFQNAAGQIVLEYGRAIQESVFEQLRVVHDGQLRIVFSPDLKICSWVFCAWRHEDVVPRRLIIPQSMFSHVGRLGAVAQRCSAAAQNSLNVSMQDLQKNCNTFLSSTHQLAKTLEVPLINELGYTKRFVRCLQISEVVNCMKDLIDYGKDTGKGPIECLAMFPGRTNQTPKLHNQPEEQQQLPLQNTGQSMENHYHALQGSPAQIATGSGPPSGNIVHSVRSTISATTMVGRLNQNSMNCGHENQINIPSRPFSAAPVEIPSAGSSTTLLSTQENPFSPFSDSTLSSSHNPPPESQSILTAEASANHITSENSPLNIPLQKSSQSSEAGLNEHMSSVDKIIQEIMGLSQFSGMGSMTNLGSARNIRNNGSGMAQISHTSLGGGNNTMGAGINNKNSSVQGAEFGNFLGGIGVSGTTHGIRAPAGNNSMTSCGMSGMPLMPQDATMDNQQQELSPQFLIRVGEVHDFNNLQFN